MFVSSVRVLYLWITMHLNCKQAIGQGCHDNLCVAKVSANRAHPIVPIMFVPYNVDVVIANVTFLVNKAIRP